MEENLKYWVALNLILAERLKLTQKILQHFPSVQEIFKAHAEDFVEIGVEQKIVDALASRKVLDKADKVIDSVYKKGYTIVTIEDNRYPEYLREIFDPPIVLYCAGQVEILKEPAVSIVGTRNPTPYGRAVAERLAHDLAVRGVVVVSGLARGIDSVAHWGALKGGKTVAVLGSGLDNIYPRENRRLFNSIIENGAVVSEFPLKSPPLGLHFPIRNRIISGLSLATIIVEAARRSGSLISARLALEQNREVMAVPGNITSEMSQGTNWLLQAGAKLVEGWEDVAMEFPSPLKEHLLSQKEAKDTKLPDMNMPEKEIYEFLKPDELIHIDEIVEKSELSVSEVLTHLLNLELKGWISQRPGKYFSRNLSC